MLVLASAVVANGNMIAHVYASCVVNELSCHQHQKPSRLFVRFHDFRFVLKSLCKGHIHLMANAPGISFFFLFF